MDIKLKSSCAYPADNNSVSLSDACSCFQLYQIKGLPKPLLDYHLVLVCVTDHQDRHHLQVLRPNHPQYQGCHEGLLYMLTTKAQNSYLNITNDNICKNKSIN